MNVDTGDFSSGANISHISERIASLPSELEPAKPAHDLIKDWPLMPAEAEHGLAGEVAS